MRLCDCWQELPKRHDAILRKLRDAYPRSMTKDDLAPPGDRYPRQHTAALKDLGKRGLIRPTWPDDNPYGAFVLSRDGLRCFGDDAPKPEDYAPDYADDAVFVRIV